MNSDDLDADIIAALGKSPGNPQTTDLFARVTRGVRRRRRNRSIAAAASAFIVVGIVAAVPALTAAGRPGGHDNALSGPASSSPTTPTPTPGAPSQTPRPGGPNGPAGSPQPLVTSGGCAGLEVSASYSGTTYPVLPSPAANTITLRVGQTLTLRASGPCSGSVSYSAQGPAVAMPPKQVVIDGFVLAGVKPGSETLDVLVPGCAGVPATLQPQC
ncbi:MAG: hypothetical protein ACRDNS_24825, partial [Trebonia sp.]